MELADWIAVILAGNAAVAVGIVWHGPLFRTGRELIEGSVGEEVRQARSYGPMVVVMLIGATMLAHSFARIGHVTLAAKPWLYFMQSGGVALAFIIPAVWISHARSGISRRARLVDCGFWLVAYLAMGLVFWALG